MCELFGAYGWSEGNRLCKWLADYMLVRGVNHFVPHAFDAAPFPDADCPPHFYAHGHVDKDDEGHGTLRRIRKDSFYWYKQVIATNGEDLG